MRAWPSIVWLDSDQYKWNQESRTREKLLAGKTEKGSKLIEVYRRTVMNSKEEPSRTKSNNLRCGPSLSPKSVLCNSKTNVPYDRSTITNMSCVDQNQLTRRGPVRIKMSDCLSGAAPANSQYCVSTGTAQY